MTDDRKVRRWSRSRNCKNCRVEKKAESPACLRCHKHPDSKDMWRPDAVTAEKIVQHYIGQMRWSRQRNISAVEIATNEGIAVEIIEAAMASLMKAGVLKTEATVVIVE